MRPYLPIMAALFAFSMVGADTIPYVRTPDTAFAHLKDFPWGPHYVYAQPGHLRMHYLDEGPRNGPIILLMHGNPSWCYIYRKMIPQLLDAGARVIAPDLIGFGRSDKPVNRTDQTYLNHDAWITSFITQLDLNNITLFCQDWGGLIGLRVAAENGSRYARIIAANTGLPTGADPARNPAFAQWETESQTMPSWQPVIENATFITLSDSELAAYDAPFPSEIYKAGPRQLPQEVPDSTSDLAVSGNIAAWGVFDKWTKPFATAWGMKDPIFKGPGAFLNIPGANGAPHSEYQNASHFIQEDVPADLAQLIISLMGLSASPVQHGRLTKANAVPKTVRTIAVAYDIRGRMMPLPGVNARQGRESTSGIYFALSTTGSLSRIPKVTRY